MDQLLLDFLTAYAEYLDWPERGFDAIARKICEEYKYSPQHGREFLLIAFGWMWGKNQGNKEFPFIQANCECGLLKLKLDEVWTQVAKENDWPLEQD